MQSSTADVLEIHPHLIGKADIWLIRKLDKAARSSISNDWILSSDTIRQFSAVENTLMGAKKILSEGHFDIWDVECPKEELNYFEIN